MESLTQWIWVWVNSGSWWWTGRPGVLQSMGSQRVRHDWVTELNWTEPYVCISFKTELGQWMAGWMGGWMNGSKELHYFLEEVIVTRNLEKEKEVSEFPGSLVIILDFHYHQSGSAWKPHSQNKQKTKQKHNKVRVI